MRSRNAHGTRTPGGDSLSVMTVLRQPPSGRLAAAAFIVLVALALVVGHPEVMYSIDSAIKYLQAHQLWSTGYGSIVMPYPAQAIDPDRLLFPFVSPFVFRSAGDWQGIFPSAFAMLVAPLSPLGPVALKVIALGGGVAAAWATARLAGPDDAWPAAALLLLATPAWFYAIGSSEVPLALALSTSAFLAAREAGGQRGALLTGTLLGLAAVLRDECLLLLPGLLFARWLVDGSRASLARIAAATCAPILAVAVIDRWWFERPALAHLRHAIPWLEAWLPRSRALLPHLPLLSWWERYQIVAEYWWLGGVGPTLAAALAGWIGAIWTFRRTPAGRWLVAALALALVAAQALDLITLLGAPKFVAGLLRLSPFVLFAILPMADGAAGSMMRRIAWVTAATYTLGIVLTLSTSGGKSLGPRLTIALWPLLVVAAWEGLSSYRREGFSYRVAWFAGLALAAGSLVMQLCVALPAWTARVQEDAAAVELLRAIPDRVLVLGDPYVLPVVTSMFFERRVVAALRPDQWGDLAACLDRASLDSVTIVSRESRRNLVIPGFRYREAWTPSRFWIGRWTRR